MKLVSVKMKTLLLLVMIISAEALMDSEQNYVEPASETNSHNPDAQTDRVHDPDSKWGLGSKQCKRKLFPPFGITSAYKLR